MGVTWSLGEGKEEQGTVTGGLEERQKKAHRFSWRKPSMDSIWSSISRSRRFATAYISCSCASTRIFMLQIWWCAVRVYLVSGWSWYARHATVLRFWMITFVMVGVNILVKMFSRGWRKEGPKVNSMIGIWIAVLCVYINSLISLSILITVWYIWVILDFTSESKLPRRV